MGIIVNQDDILLGKVREEGYHAEIVAVIEHPPTRCTVMFPVTKGVHVLIDRPQAVEGARAFVTFPHIGWKV